MNPIVSVYNNGPIVSDEFKSIAYKVETTYTLMEETLLCIESGQFNWML